MSLYRNPKADAVRRGAEAFASEAKVAAQPIAELAQKLILPNIPAGTDAAAQEQTRSALTHMAHAPNVDLNELDRRTKQTFDLVSSRLGIGGRAKATALIRRTNEHERANHPDRHKLLGNTPAGSDPRIVLPLIAEQQARDDAAARAVRAGSFKPKAPKA